MARQRLTQDNKKGCLAAAFSGTSLYDHPLFIEFSGHVDAVIGAGAGNFIA